MLYEKHVDFKRTILFSDNVYDIHVHVYTRMDPYYIIMFSFVPWNDIVLVFVSIIESFLERPWKRVGSRIVKRY